MPLANLSWSGEKVITSAASAAEWLAHVSGWPLQLASYQVATIIGGCYFKLSSRVYNSI